MKGDVKESVDVTGEGGLATTELPYFEGRSRNQRSRGGSHYLRFLLRRERRKATQLERRVEKLEAQKAILKDIVKSLNAT